MGKVIKADSRPDVISSASIPTGLIHTNNLHLAYSPRFPTMKGLLSLFGLLALAMMVVADEALFRNITKQYKKQLKSQLASHTSGCTEGNVAVRKEWFELHKILPREVVSNIQ